MAATLEKIPVFEGQLEEKITNIIDWISANICRRQWSNDEIDQKFAKRSAAQILEDRHTCYMNPCLDYTLLTIDILKRNGYLPTLVIEVLEDPAYPFRSLHFAVEFADQGQTYFLDYNSLTTVAFGKGSYYNIKKGLTQVDIMRVDGALITPAKFFLECLPEDIMARMQPSFNSNSFALQLEKLKRDNTLKTYSAYRQRIGNDETLKIVMVNF